MSRYPNHSNDSVLSTKISPLAYISLTWNGENRFGGGTGSKAGLKADGKELLKWMSAHRVPLDFSHASDRLAEDCLNYIEQQGLSLPVLASHSNFRAITPQERNLPDWLAKELIAREGLIGINLFTPFIGSAETLIRHLEHALALKGEKALAFGADFFCDTDFPDLLSKYGITQAYLPSFDNAACFPRLLSFIEQNLQIDLESLAHRNATQFFKRPLSKFM